METFFCLAGISGTNIVIGKREREKHIHWNDQKMGTTAPTRVDGVLTTEFSIHGGVFNQRHIAAWVLYLRWANTALALLGMYVIRNACSFVYKSEIRAVEAGEQNEQSDVVCIGLVGWLVYVSCIAIWPAKALQNKRPRAF